MAVSSNPGSKIHVLLVDDDNDVRESLAEILKDMGVFSTIVEAVDGKDGFYKYQNQAFDIIITDLVMPKVSGLEFIQNLFGFKEKATPPIILLSGNLTGAEVQKSIKLGVKYVLVKPCSEEQLVNKVEQVLKSDVSRKVINL